MTDLSVSAILDPDGMREYAMQKRKQLLESIEHSPVRQMTGKDTRWYCYVKDKTAPHGRRMVRGSSIKDVEDRMLEMCYGEQKSVTVGDCFRRWIDFRKAHNRRLSPGSFSIYEQGYRKYFKDTAFSKRKITSVKAPDFENFMLAMVEKYGLTMKPTQQLAGYCRSLLRQARRDGLVSEDVWKDVSLADVVYSSCAEEKETPERLRVFSQEEAARLTEAVERHLSKHPGYIPDLAILIAKYTGMRPAEIAALAWEDIQDGGYILLRHAERRYKGTEGTEGQVFEVTDTKTHKERLVPICDELAAVLGRIKAVQESHGWDTPWVYCFESKGKVGRQTANSLEKAIRRRTAEAKIDGTGTVYRFRRTMESGLRQQMKPDAAIAHMMGHSAEVGRRFYTVDMESTDAMKAAVSALYE